MDAFNVKYALSLTLMLLACKTTAQTNPKPNGEQVILAILEASEQDLSEEPLCNIGPTGSSESYTLKDYLSVVLATSYENKNTTSITTTCTASKTEPQDGQLIDIWDCLLTTYETSPSGEFISASTIALGLDKNKLIYIPQTLRCF